MSDELIRKINKYCDPRGDKLIELMDRCHVYNTPSVPEEMAIQYLAELEGAALCVSQE